MSACVSVWIVLLLLFILPVPARPFRAPSWCVYLSGSCGGRAVACRAGPAPGTKWPAPRWPDRETRSDTPCKHTGRPDRETRWGRPYKHTGRPDRETRWGRPYKHTGRPDRETRWGTPCKHTGTLRRTRRNILFNDALNTFTVIWRQTYGKGHHR